MLSKSLGLCAVSVLAGHLSALGQSAPAARIGVVMIQDHGGNSLAFTELNNRLRALLRTAGYESELLEFRPSGDVDHAARAAGCGHILYTDIAEIRRAGGPLVAGAVKDVGGAVSGTGKAKSRDIWEAEVEFRLFTMDQVPPLVATSVTGRNSKHGTRAGAQATAMPASSRTVSPQRPEPDLLTQTTPIDQEGRLKKHKSAAVAAALEREVKTVRERLREPATRASD